MTDTAAADAKSVITCDLEGRIETVNDGAERIFGWKREELVGHKRVSLFSPGLVVLAHVNNWLQTSVKEGKYEGRTVFLRKDGSRFAAQVRITPTFRTVDGEKKQIGYCGVTEPLPDVDPQSAMPPIPLPVRIFRWLVVTRAPFLTATVVPVLVGAAWLAATRGPGSFGWADFGLTLLVAVALHLAANTSNDYFDWKSGTDQANNDYFLPFSGGSRSIELGLVSERGLLGIALGSLLVAALAGLPLMIERGPKLLAFGAVGAFAAWFYTAPPLRLAARKGLGELFVGLCFGPLMVAGTVFALSGHVAWPDFAAGLPAGLLTTAILWINEFPDAASDAATGKLNLVVVLGKARARWGYVLLTVFAFAAVVGLVLDGLCPPGALVALLALPLAIKAVRTLFRHYEDRELVGANATTIQLHLATGLLMAAGLAWGQRVLHLVVH